MTGLPRAGVSNPPCAPDSLGFLWAGCNPEHVSAVVTTMVPARVTAATMVVPRVAAATIAATVHSTVAVVSGSLQLQTRRLFAKGAAAGLL